MSAKRMTAAEAVMLCRFAKACCPQQQFDEYTPDAWHELLGDLRFEDCKDAVVAVTKRQPFCAPAEIRAEVKRLRFARLDAFGPFDPPAELGTSPVDYSQWIADMNRRICDGSLTREQYDAERGQLERGARPALDETFRRTDEDDAA